MTFLPALKRVARPSGILVGYGVLFALFETQATFFEVGPGVSLYYPSAGLNLALVLIFGLEYTPAIFIAGLASSLWINSPAIPIQHFLIPGLAITAGNGVAAWWLRQTLQTRALFSPGTALRLAGVMAALAAWNSLSAVSGYLLTGMEGYALNTAGTTVALWWVADWAGMLICTLPLMLGALGLFAPETLGAWAENASVRWSLTPGGTLELLGEMGAIVLSLYAAFFLQGAPHLLYLCFLPLLWMALRHGLPRSALGVLLISLGAALSLRILDDPGSMLQLQLFVIALSLTGLFLGALVSERKRAFRTLQRGLEALNATGSNTSAAAVPTSRSMFDEDGLRLATTLHAGQQRLVDEAGALQDQNRRKDQLFSIIAHDLRNLVGSSASLAEVLEDEAGTLSSETTARFARHLNRSTRQAFELLDDLLEWGHVYVGGARDRMGTVNVAAFVESAAEHLAQRAAQKRVYLEVEIDPALTAHGHAGLLQSVMRNLFSNAIKFSEPGGRIEAHAAADAEGVTISVRDHGVGIPPDQLDTLFEPRTGASRDGTQGERGTGLGLVLCRDIVEQHGGTIWAESQPSQGSSFSFTLPSVSTRNGDPAAEASR